MNNYSAYLINGIKTITSFLSANSVDSGMKDAIIDAFTDELTNCLYKVEPDYVDVDYLAHCVIVSYYDAILLKALSETGETFVISQDILEICDRQKVLVNSFRNNGWSLPTLKVNDLDSCKHTLKKRFDGNVITNRVIKNDKLISELTKKATSEIDLESCNAVLELLPIFQADLDKCRDKHIPIPDISITNPKNTEKMILAVKRQAEQKDALWKKIEHYDLQIYNIISCVNLDVEQLNKTRALCKTQIKNLDECKNNGWNIPRLKVRNPEKLEEQFSLYLNMVDLDKTISDNKEGITSNAHLNKIKNYCNQQAGNISKCNENDWPLPSLKNTDLESVIANGKKQIELSKTKTIKSLKRWFTLAGVVTVILLCLFGYYKYTNSRVKIPFSAEYPIGKNYETISDELEQAGFTSIKTVSSDAGWLNDNEVISVTINGFASYQQNTRYKPNANVVITYSNPGRINVTNILKNWQSTEYSTIKGILNNSGFTNIIVKEIPTTKQSEDGLVDELLFDGRPFNGQLCHLSKNAEIVISRYKYMVEIGEFLGRDYKDVLEELKLKGFASVKTEEITTGWAKDYTVVGVIADGDEIDNENQLQDPNAEIIVRYSSGNRVDITELFDGWKEKKYSEVLPSLNFTHKIHNVTLVSKSWEYRDDEHMISSIKIDDKWFTKGDCYVNKDANIIIEYYEAKIEIERKSSEYKNEPYLDVKEELTEKGFTNIQLFRTNKVGWIEFDKPGTIKSISIDGVTDFKDTDKFYYDAPIVIIVHTKKTGCYDITDVAD